MRHRLPTRVPMTPQQELLNCLGGVREMRTKTTARAELAKVVAGYTPEPRKSAGQIARGKELLGELRAAMRTDEG